MNYSFHPKLTAALALFGAGVASVCADPKPLAAVESPRGQPLATVKLENEYQQIAGLNGYILYQNLITVPPGTGRKWHSHAGRPEIVRILSGVLTDQRNDGEPKSYGPGTTLINADGVQHMWANFGKEPVVFLATSIRGPEAQPRDEKPKAAQ
jgi:quercetin dioxygenase-like cupin family protein